MANRKITELPAATIPITTGVKFEAVQGGINVQVDADDLPGVATTREFNRTFSETLVFDKNEIFHEPFSMSDDINLEIGSGLVDQSSAMRFRVTADGVHAINFGSGFDFIYGITNGEILDAGTYEVYLLYTNGSVVVNVPGVSSQTSGLTPISTPANFTVVADGENALDLSWDDVDNEVEYQIEKSLTGTSGWVLFSNPAADATSDTETGLNPGDHIFYRIKAIGDGVTTQDSAYATANGTTESTGDVTAPVPTFLPANGNAVWPVNRPLTITMDEAIRDDDGVTTVTSANAADYIVLKETNSGGANIAFTATYDSGSKTFTITPTTTYGTNQLVYLALDGIEDLNGNEMTLQSITFTTTEYTYFNGTSNRLIFGDILDSLFSVDNATFRYKATIKNIPLVGTRVMLAKWSTSDNQRSFQFYLSGASVRFIASLETGALFYGVALEWANVLDADEHEIEMRYRGDIDTDTSRCELYIDGVSQGAPTVISPGTYPKTIYSSTAQLAFGIGVSATNVPYAAAFFSGEAKDLILETGAGTDEINIPVLRLGTDTSGNARHGTWV